MEVELNSSIDDPKWIDNITRAFAETQASNQCATLVIGDQEIPLRFGPQYTVTQIDTKMAIIKCEMLSIRK